MKFLFILLSLSIQVNAADFECSPYQDQLLIIMNEKVKAAMAPNFELEMRKIYEGLTAPSKIEVDLFFRTTGSYTKYDHKISQEVIGGTIAVEAGKDSRNFKVEIVSVSPAQKPLLLISGLDSIQDRNSLGDPIGKPYCRSRIEQLNRPNYATGLDMNLTVRIINLENNYSVFYGTIGFGNIDFKSIVDSWIKVELQ